MTSTRSLPGVRLAARRSASTHMAGQLRSVQPAAPISANGLCARAWRWIGPNTPKADMMALSATPNTPAAESGRAATSSRGSIEPASAQAESPPTVRTTQTPILDGLQCGVSIHNEWWPIPRVAQVALAWFGRLTLTHRSEPPDCTKE